MKFSEEDILLLQKRQLLNTIVCSDHKIALLEHFWCPEVSHICDRELKSTLVPDPKCQFFVFVSFLVIILIFSI